MTPLIWSVLGVMTIGAVLAGFAFRRVIEIEFDQFHDQWLKDGKPVGGAGSRRAASFWHSDRATQRVYLEWMFRTPEWATQSPEAVRLLAVSRWLMIGFGIGMLGLIAIALLAT